jgi:hypothetical protein
MRKLERGELTITYQTFNIANAVRDVLQVRTQAVRPARCPLTCMCIVPRFSPAAWAFSRALASAG